MTNSMKKIASWGYRMQDAKYRVRKHLTAFMLVAMAVSVGVCLFTPDLTGAEDTILSSNANLEGKNKHLTFNILNPNAVYDITHEVCVWPKTDTAITITNIEVTCDVDPGAELDIDLKWDDTFIGRTDGTLIVAIPTTAGTASISSGWNDNTVPAGKCIYVSFGEVEPDSNINQIAFDIIYHYDYGNSCRKFSITN